MSQFRAGLAAISRELTKGSAPAGRPMAKALPPDSQAAPRTTISGEQFMAKALTANREGRLSAAEVGEIESAIAHGRQPRAELVKAVVLETPVGLRGEHGATFAKLQANLGVAPMAKAESIHTRAPAARLAPSERQLIGGITSDHFLARAMSAQAAGHINGAEVAECEACVNSGRQPRPQLVSKVLEAVA